MMAQKINSLTFRLKKRLNWKINLAVHNFLDYSNSMLNSVNILTTYQKLLFHLKIMQNNNFLLKSSKTYKISLKTLNQNFYFFFFKILILNKSTQHFYNYRDSYLKLFSKVLKKYLFISNKLENNLGSIQTQKKLNKSLFLKSNFITLSPKIFLDFAKIQLKKNDIITILTSNFNKTLQKSILKFIEIVLKNYNYDIIGLKIICSGRWKKTSTGRKQKLFLKFGQIKSSDISNKITYQNLSQVTRFGICSIKIWIAQKL